MYEEPPFDTGILPIGTGPKKTIRVQIDYAQRYYDNNNGWDLSSSRHMPDSVLSALHASSYLLLTTVL